VRLNLCNLQVGGIFFILGIYPVCGFCGNTKSQQANIGVLLKFYSPTDAQLNCLKNSFKFTLKLTLKQLQHVCVNHHHQGAHYSDVTETCLSCFNPLTLRLLMSYIYIYIYIYIYDISSLLMSYIYIYDISSLRVNDLTLTLLTWRKWWAPNNASKQQMGFNSAFKGLNAQLNPTCHLLALLGDRHILHVSRIRVNVNFNMNF